uniref:RNA helicase n=1 Tax=Hyaloperonospora arabidopsidis (strain Emoy2) TaxID=559515 RepID=M4C3Q1_HYAAE
MSVKSNIQEPVGNSSVNKVRKVRGSKPRRKRKLSEGALEEQLMEDEARRQASLLLAPPKSKAKKCDAHCRRSSMELVKSKEVFEQSDEEAAVSSEEEGQDVEEEEDEEEEVAVRLFKLHGKSVDEEMTVTQKVKKTKKGAAQKSTDDSADREGVRMLRRQLGIHVSGVSVPVPITSFADMRLDPVSSAQQMKRLLLQNIERSEYKEPTPVQMQAIPSFLLRHDVLVTAPTGSGKTAAFAIPILANLAASSATSSGIRSIVLAPTRDLAVQIRAEFTRLATGKKMHITLLSKATAATIASQTKSKLAVNHDVLIATPLRLVHLIQEAKVDLSTVEIVCLDEADRLLELGFVEQIDEIFAACTHANIQRAMFSATMLEGVEELAHTVLRDPVKNKERANELYHELLYDGVNIGAVHADRTKEQRDDVIARFRTGEVWMLICTDLMSRGMDFKAVNMVINYDFPQSAVSYIHRIGRTGRNGRKGKAVTFFTEDDMVHLRTIANVMKLSGCEVPDWILSLKKASASKRKELLKAPPMRHRINTISGYDLQKAHRLKQMKHAKLKVDGDTNNQPEPLFESRKKLAKHKKGGEGSSQSKL